MIQHTCLFCHTPLDQVFADLGTCPPSNAFLTAEQCEEPEIYHPLRAYVCEKCLLVQGPHFKRPQDIFNHDYVYQSSWSRSWVEHARQYVHQTVQRFALDKNSRVIELGSNDGYLLQHVMALGIPCIGIDPSAGAASVAQAKGIVTITDFFSAKLATALKMLDKQADLVCGINVFAHVPDINDFIDGISTLLKPGGVVTMEFPHLLRLVEDVQFDTIYHEHYFYYSLTCVRDMLSKHGLRIFDAEELPTHGGSLRVYACHTAASHASTGKCQQIIAKEVASGMNHVEFYLNFQQKIDRLRNQVMRFLMDAKDQGKMVAGFGAAAKGNTMINYFGIRRDMLPFVADTSPVKQGLYLPGSRIPVRGEQAIHDAKPDYILILPWNLKAEISEQLSYIREWGGKFVTTIPRLEVW